MALHDHQHKTWEELPPEAVKAAKVLGYTQQIWDNDEWSTLSFFKNPITKASVREKQASMYLGMDPMAEGRFSGIYWNDLDVTARRHAESLGWDETKWDEDWYIQDLPVNEKYWKELSQPEKRAAEYFGYMECTWDEVEGPFAPGNHMTGMSMPQQGQKQQQHQQQAPQQSSHRPQKPFFDKNNESKEVEDDKPMFIDMCADLCWKKTGVGMIVNKVLKRNS